MSGRRYVLLLLAIWHLSIVICGAAYGIPDWHGGPPARILRWYATISGAGSSYGFFAPAVGAPHRARFLLKDDQGLVWSDGFERAGNPEARLRLTGIVEAAFMTRAAQESPPWRQRLVESWSATMFSRHPEAVSLTVTVEAYYVPDMAEYRSGARPRWITVYRAQVQRRSPAEEEETER
jgi:hypothetical protein